MTGIANNLRTGDDVRALISSLPALGWKNEGMQLTREAVCETFAIAVDNHGAEQALMGLLWMTLKIAKTLKPNCDLNKIVL